MNELTLCRSCGVAFIGNYCNHCGEKKFREKDRSVKQLLKEAFHFLVHLDGSFFRTVATMLTKPGKMSADICNGVQKKYFKPLSFFLLLVVLYLVFPFFHGLNMDLEYYFHNPFFGNYAHNKMTALQPAYQNFAGLSAAFHHKTEKIAKFLLFILIPMMAAFTYLACYKKKRFYYDHFILNTEILSFFVLWGFLLLPFLTLLIHLCFPQLEIEDDIFVTLIAGGTTIYAALASRRFFRLKVWQCVLFALMYFAVLFYIAEQIYKFILFNLAAWFM